jgi:two-component system response regulator AtoC
MATRTILVVDDDEDARAYLAMLLSSMGYEVQTAESGEQALSHLAVPDAPAVVLLDLLMPGMSGLDVLDHIQRTRPALPVIVQSTVAEIKTVVDAVRRGASDYLTKPFQEQELELALGNVLEKKELKEEVSLLRRRLDENEGEFVSSHPRLLRIKEIARQVAPTDAPVLVLGESGVGKEVVARLIHACSRRQGQPFVKINCAALPQDLLESELFGYERGAFSGALREKPGMFEVAKRGTILLDEIGEMSCHLQAKLLHVLQDGQYTTAGRPPPHEGRGAGGRVDQHPARGGGGGGPVPGRPLLPPERGAHRHPAAPRAAGGHPAAVRPLHAQLCGPVRQPRPAASAGAAGGVRRHDWPGNVRELENAVRRFTILPDVEMALADLERSGNWAQAAAPAAIPVEEAVPAREEAALRPPDSLSLRQVASRAAEDAERKLVRRVLAETKWHRKEAAVRLKVSYKAL